MDMDRLEYFISEKNGIVVVSLLGILTVETVTSLEKVFEEVQSRHPRLAIINCHDLLDMDARSINAVANLNECIRSIPATVSYCFVHPTVRKLLLDAGTLQEDDIKSNFIEAVDAISDQEKVAA